MIQVILSRELGLVFSSGLNKNNKDNILKIFKDAKTLDDIKNWIDQNASFSDRKNYHDAVAKAKKMPTWI